VKEGTIASTLLRIVGGVCVCVYVCVRVYVGVHVYVCAMCVVEGGGLKKEESWYVESVLVTDERGMKWACPYRQWLSLYHTDCQVCVCMCPGRT